MSHALITHLRRLAPLTEAECGFLLEVANQENFAKGEPLIALPGRCDRVFWVQEGVARHFYHSPQGQEITTWFSEVGDLATDVAAFTWQTPTTFQVEALTDMRVLSLTRESLQALFDASKNWERVGRLLNQQYLIQLIERSNDMALKSARERYEAFSHSHGHLFNQIPLKHIASYLCITLETLSRLRSAKI